MSYQEGFADEDELNCAIQQTIGEVDALYQEVGKLQESWREAFGSSTSREATGRYGDFIWGALTTTLNYDDIEQDFFDDIFVDFDPSNTEETESAEPEEIIPEQNDNAVDPIIQENTLPQPDMEAANAGSSRTIQETPSSETQSMKFLRLESPSSETQSPKFVRLESPESSEPKITLPPHRLGLKRANSTPPIQETRRRTGTLAKDPIPKHASCIKQSEHLGLRPWLESNASSLIKSSDTVESNSDSELLQPIKAVRFGQQTVDCVARNSSTNRVQKKAGNSCYGFTGLKNEPGLDRALESNSSAGCKRKIPISVSWFITADDLDDTESSSDQSEGDISVHPESPRKMDGSDLHKAETAVNENTAGSSCGAAKKEPSAFWLDLKTSGRIPSLIPLPRWKRRSSDLFFSDSSSTRRHSSSNSTNNSQEEGEKRPWLESNASALVETAFTSRSNSLTPRRQIEDRMSAPVRPVSHNNPPSSYENIPQKNDRSSSPHTRRPQAPRKENLSLK
uniref:Putative molybdopterin-guanine dinucleotide biosynthesis protein A n=2 Tax=Lygus hesperus TaxID=30085 RepID=A0A0A9XTQ5_LYGHE